MCHAFLEGGHRGFCRLASLLLVRGHVALENVSTLPSAFVSFSDSNALKCRGGESRDSAATTVVKKQIWRIAFSFGFQSRFQSGFVIPLKYHVLLP